jgi:hypothetical protein
VHNATISQQNLVFSFQFAGRFGLCFGAANVYVVLWSMATPERIGIQDLVVGGRYLHVNGLFIRQIDNIEGDTVIYHDQYGGWSVRQADVFEAVPCHIYGFRLTQRQSSAWVLLP